MAAKIGLLGKSFVERNRERLLPKSNHSDLEYCNGGNCLVFRALSDCIAQIYRKLYKMGHSDPRKVLFAMKAGLSLAIISLAIYIQDHSPFSKLTRCNPYQRIQSCSGNIFCRRACSGYCTIIRVSWKL